MNFPIDSKLSRAMVLNGFLLVVAYGPAMADEEVEIEADFKPCASPCVTVSGATGELEYEAEFLSNGVTIKEAELKATVKIPVVNSLGISAINAGTPGLVTLDLARINPTTQLGATYATCTMVLKSKGTSKGFTYSLKLSVELKNGLLVFGKKLLGSCDIDPTAIVQLGIPAIQNGDMAFVAVNGTTDILSALLKSEDDDDQGEDDDHQGENHQ